jgi:hypothetical protein
VEEALQKKADNICARMEAKFAQALKKNTDELLARVEAALAKGDTTTNASVPKMDHTRDPSRNE